MARAAGTSDRIGGMGESTGDEETAGQKARRGASQGR